MAKSCQQLITEALAEISEIAPWDLQQQLQQQPDTLILDVREPQEYASVRLQGSIHVPRGQLEQACEWGFAETIPELVRARSRPVVVACRSGNRSALAALTLKLMGYQQPISLKLGIKGCNDAEIALFDHNGAEVDPDWADTFLSPPVAAEQLGGEK